MCVIYSREELEGRTGGLNGAAMLQRSFFGGKSSMAFHKKEELDGNHSGEV